jgi:catechol 2,3-dioxygenase-like lactoylglutathione lyase family enzyme
MNFRIEHLGLPALDPAALCNWYVRVLDARVVWSQPGPPPVFFLTLPGDGMLLELYAAARQLPDTGDNTVAGWRHVALRVDSLEAARERLAARGVGFAEPVRPAGGGGRVLFFRDPEGNLLHLVERPPGAFA